MLRVTATNRQRRSGIALLKELTVISPIGTAGQDSKCASLAELYIDDGIALNCDKIKLEVVSMLKPRRQRYSE
jgi:hypothetical protein